MFFILVLCVYVASLCQLYIYEGPKLPLLFVALWIVGFFGAGLFGPSAGMAFLAWQAILCVVMQLVLKFCNPGRF